MARSSNYLLSRFVFDHLWGIPGDTEDHQVKLLGMSICNIASTDCGCCRAISLWLFVTRVYGANGHQQRLCLFVWINKHAFVCRWNFFKSFALNKLEVKPRLLLFPTRRGWGWSPTWKTSCTAHNSWTVLRIVLLLFCFRFRGSCFEGRLGNTLTDYCLNSSVPGVR